MKIYTKTGDNGTTSLFGAGRVSKSNARVDAYGTLDELNCFIGQLRDVLSDEFHKNLLLQIQNDIFLMGSHLATPDSNKPNNNLKIKIKNIDYQHITDLEKAIDTMNEDLPEMTHFILPGGHLYVSYCHIARSVCRRAERVCVALHETDNIDNTIITYLNRLSDYFFVLARKLAKDLQVQEILWKS